jgi:hypothetical protein
MDSPVGVSVTARRDGIVAWTAGYVLAQKTDNVEWLRLQRRDT